MVSGVSGWYWRAILRLDDGERCVAGRRPERQQQPEAGRPVQAGAIGRADQEDGAADGEAGGGDQPPRRPLAKQGDREDGDDDRCRAEGDQRGDGDADALDRPEVQKLIGGQHEADQAYQHEMTRGGPEAAPPQHGGRGEPEHRHGQRQPQEGDRQRGRLGEGEDGTSGDADRPPEDGGQQDQEEAAARGRFFGRRGGKPSGHGETDPFHTSHKNLVGRTSRGTPRACQRQRGGGDPAR